MEKITAAKAAEFSGAQLVHGPADTVIGRVERDSRSAVEESLFIAIIGENNDGNNYVEQAYENGCRAFLISSEKAKEQLEQHADAAVLMAENTKEALYKMAAAYLAQFDILKIAVTGSAGKTTTKDMLKCMFSYKYKTVANFGNYNNDIGVSLTAFEVDSTTEAAIFEMGMNHLGEIHLLADIVRPQYACITNVGDAHIGELGSRENIMKAKMEIADFMDENCTLVYNIDNDMLAGLADMETPYKKLAAGYDADQDGVIMVILNQGGEEGLIASSPGASGEEGISFILRYNEENMMFYLPVPGIYNASNAAAAAGCALAAGMELAECSDALMSLKLTGHRMANMRSGAIRILDDTYNANPSAMKAAMDVLCSTYGVRRVAVLADMLELGEDAPRYHAEIGEYAAQKGINVLVSVGEQAEAMTAAAKEAREDIITFCFADHSEFEAHAAEIIEPGDVVLVKGSHSMHMDESVSRLKMVGTELDGKENEGE